MSGTRLYSRRRLSKIAYTRDNDIQSDLFSTISHRNRCFCSSSSNKIHEALKTASTSMHRDEILLEDKYCLKAIWQSMHHSHIACSPVTANLHQTTIQNKLFECNVDSSSAQKVGAKSNSSQQSSQSQRKQTNFLILRPHKSEFSACSFTVLPRRMETLNIERWRSHYKPRVAYWIYVMAVMVRKP